MAITGEVVATGGGGGDYYITMMDSNGVDGNYQFRQAIPGDGALTYNDTGGGETLKSRFFQGDLIGNADTAISSSYALTASFALNAGGADTGSLMVTGSVSLNTLTFTKGDGSTFNLTVDTGSAVTTPTLQQVTTEGNSTNLAITASALRIENNTHLDGTLLVTNNTIMNGDLTIQSATPNLKLRDTSGGGFSSGYDIRVDTGSFEIYDDTHNRDVLSDFFNIGTSKHTTSLTSEIIVISGSDSVTILGPTTLTGSLNGNADTATSASYALTASFALNADNAISSSYALTASYIEGGVNPFPLTGSIDALIPSGSVFSVRSTGGGTSWGPDIILMGNYSGSNVAISKTSANSYNNIIIGAGTNTSPNRIISSSLDGNVLIGGASNRASGRAQRATIVGGFNNQIASGSDLGGSATIQNNGIFAGSSNQIVHGSGNFIGGGSSNTIVSSSFDTTPSQNAILGGNFNQITGSDNSALIGGLRNRIADASLSAIIAGTGSIVTGTQSAVIAGRNHLASHSASVVIGGNNLSTTQDNEVVVPNLTISGSGNVLTFADGTTQSTAATGGSTFPYTGSAIISGSLEVTGSINIDVNSSISGSNLVGNWADTYSTSPKVHQIVTLTQAEYNALTPNENTLYVISGSTFTAANTAGNNTFTENNVFSGSVRGDVGALSITSNTASMDCSEGNFFTITLVSGSTTHLNPTNIQPGQTINLLVNTTGSGLLTFAPSVLQVTGSAYTATTGSGTIGKDIITFISFNSTNLYLSNIKNFI
jgi:hypothetical protein